MTGADDSNLQARRASYSTLGSQFAQMDDREFRAALKPLITRQSPWRYTYESAVGGPKVFVKRLPLSEIERAHPWSTRNLFRLPTYYSYGVGSAGFGAWRELVGHIKTTNWVLEGASPAFPLLVHHRVLPRTATRKLPNLDAYVERWNGSRAIGDAMRVRGHAAHEIWLVLEYIPHEMTYWILEHQSRVDNVVSQLCEVTAFLRERGMVHFDLHFGNVVTDGEAIRVVDFGLASDEAFHLTKTERAFLDRHRYYDLAEAIACIGLAPRWVFADMNEATRQRLVRRHGWMEPDASQTRWLTAFIDNVDALTSGPLRIEPAYADALRRYRDVILSMSDFLSTMRVNPRKNTRYDDNDMRRLLEKAGLPIE